MLANMGKRTYTKSIGTTEDAYVYLEALKERTGKPHREIVSALLEWFAQQEDDLVMPVLGEVPQIYQKDFALLVLNRLSQQDAAAWGAERWKATKRQRKSHQTKKKLGTDRKNTDAG